MKKLMLGFAGEIAAGKGTATGLVKAWYPETPSVRFSDSLREFLADFNRWKATTRFTMACDEMLVAAYLKRVLPTIFPAEIVLGGDGTGLHGFTLWITKHWFSCPSEIAEDRRNLQELSTALRSFFSEDILQKTVLARVGGMEQASLVIIEGIRRRVDIGALLCEKNFRLVYLKCCREIAYERMKNRNENAGDSEMTPGRFVELCSAEAEQEILSLEPRAHLVIDNSGPPEVLEKTLRSHVAQWLKE